MKRQRRWQLQRKAEGRCQGCGQPAAGSTRCPPCCQLNAGLSRARRARMKAEATVAFVTALEVVG